jgi:cell division protein FtsQ
MNLEHQSPEVLVEDEPRYLRRQKPLEIKRRKFGKQAWRLYLRVTLGILGAAAAIFAGYQTIHFLLYSPRFQLADLEQIEVTGNEHVSREAVLEKFAADQGRSVLRVPLDERRQELENIAWVEQATCQRLLPNRIRVEIVERRPVAFLRLATELALIDGHGVILERPLQGEFRFPVVTGISEAMPRDERERRMQLFVQFMKDVEMARPGAAEQVSEVDLSESSDLRATLAGLPELGDPAQGGQVSVLVHFGSGKYQDKFRTFVENLRQWRAAAGRLESVDLRFDRQVVVNPETVPAPATANAAPGQSRVQ